MPLTSLLFRCACHQSSPSLPIKRCPVFVIHGTQDEVVPFHHGEQIYEALPPQYRAPPFWANNLGHNDIELLQPRQFIKELRNFLRTASKSPTIQRSTRFVGSISPRSSVSDEFAPLKFGKERLITGASCSSAPLFGVESPKRIDERGPSEVREGGSRHAGILRNEDGQAIDVEDLGQGRDGRILPSPPPTSELLNANIERGSGKFGPVLGHDGVRRLRGC